LVYARKFSEKELKELIMFYESEVGQKMLRVTPFLVEQTKKEAEQSSERVLLRFKEKIDPYVKEQFDKARSYIVNH
jgi:hypothetical protein